MTTADDAIDILNKQNAEIRAKYEELDRKGKRLTRRSNFMLAAIVGAAVGYVMTVHAIDKANQL